jgi:uncharacterized membrane protein HdeD (DUF308 family)
VGHISRDAPPPHVFVMHPWIPLLHGFWAVILGEVTLFMPDLTFKMLDILFGIYALGDGMLALASAYRLPGVRPNWWLALIGVCGILAGLFVLLWPGLSVYTLLYCISAWAIVLGFCEIAGAIALREVIPGEWYWILSGTVAIVFGLVLMLRSSEGALALVWLIGSFAIIFGILLIATAYRLCKHVVDSAQTVFLSD